MGLKKNSLYSRDIQSRLQVHTPFTPATLPAACPPPPTLSPAPRPPLPSSRRPQHKFPFSPFERHHGRSQALTTQSNQGDKARGCRPTEEATGGGEPGLLAATAAEGHGDHRRGSRLPPAGSRREQPTGHAVHRQTGAGVVVSSSSVLKH